MKSLAKPTVRMAPTTRPITWKRNWMVRGVPRRQPVERSCCMSPATLQLTSRMPPAIRPTVGSFKPSAAISTTAVTKAELMGLLSLMPSEMPLTIANTNTSTMASAMKNTGWLSTLAPTHTTIAPQKITQAIRRPTCVRCQSGCGGTTSRSSGGERQRRQACTRIRPAPGSDRCPGWPPP